MKPKKKGIVKQNRTKHVSFSLNEKEYALVNSYIQKYKIHNRSGWVRETLLAHVLKSLELNYPTLFEENEMRR